MKKIIVWIAAALAILLVFGSVFSIDLDWLRDRTDDDDSDPEDEPRVIVPLLDDLLTRYALYNTIDAVYDSEVGDIVITSEKSSLIDSASTLTGTDEGGGYMYPWKSNTSVYESELVYSYSTDIVISVAVCLDVFHDETYTASGIEYWFTADGECCLFYVEQNFVYSSDHKALFSLTGVNMILSMHVNTKDRYVDFYVGNVYVHTMDLSDKIAKGEDVISAFKLTTTENFSEGFLIDYVKIFKRSVVAELSNARTYMNGSPVKELEPMQYDDSTIDVIANPDGLWTDRY